MNGFKAGVYGLGVVLVAALAGAEVAGSRLPMEHVVTASGIVAASQDQVWDMVTHTVEQDAWRRDVKHMKKEDEDVSRGSDCWEQTFRSAAMTVCLVEERPKTRQVTEVVDSSVGVKGGWTVELAPATGGTRVTITERNRIAQPLLRFFGEYLLRDRTEVRAYLTDLQTEAVRPR